ncbi:MAG TPA: dipeptide ABC transporter ATP-binding protein, partial [Burkholderiaceae bacterium]|nr:dipeptide ABC transporter ATP-binding protein [Burkholderiaceae bacterium]
VIADLEHYQQERPARFDSVVTVIDADNFDRNLDRAEVAFEQITLADLLLVNKADLVSGETLGLIEQGLRKLNARAPIVRCVQADVSLEVLVDVERTASLAPGHHDEHGHDHDHDHGHDAEDTARHGHEGFVSFGLQCSRPLDFDRFSAWIAALPEGVFRVKGFVRFDGADGPDVIHVVGRRRSTEPAPPQVQVDGARLVVIGRNLEAVSLGAGLARCQAGSEPAEAPEPAEPVLQVRDLVVEIRTDMGLTQPVKGISFDVRRGEFLGVVGESGSGKSVTFLSVLGLLPSLADCTIRGQRIFESTDLSLLGAREMRKLLGAAVSIVFQDPLSALNPAFRIGEQIADVVTAHEPRVSRDEARRRAVEALRHVRIPNPAARADDYPHQFSGGMRQRVLIAMAIVCRPRLLIADEPTTALDVTVQAEILALLDQLRREMSMAVVLITHDLGVVAAYAERVAVMYQGRIVEQAPVRDLFQRPRHTYTRSLLAGVLHLGQPLHAGRAAEAAQEPVLRVENLAKTFALGRRRGAVPAVRDVSFELRQRETLGIVGESGSGKSTMARCVMHLIEPSSGEVMLEGTRIDSADKASIRKLRDRMQLVFQDARAALNPRMTVQEIVGEPLAIRGQWHEGGAERVARMLARVGLEPEHAQRYPHEFSGGQQQRIGIARALILHPAVVVLDEPVSSLDVSIRGQIIGLLEELQREFGLSYLFIAHDLSVVHRISDRVAVMYLGRMVEIGDADSVCLAPKHPYTRLLIESVPAADPAVPRSDAVLRLSGERPDPMHPPSGCVFHTRCPLARTLAAADNQEWVEVEGDRVPAVCVNDVPRLLPEPGGACVACHFAR